MSEAGTVNKLHYIVDGSHNYYRINGRDQLVVAGSREEAGVFSFMEANQRIGGGKKAHFYSAIPVEEKELLTIDFESSELDTKELMYTIPEVEKVYDLEEKQNDLEACNAEIRMSLPYDMKSMDWHEYLTHFCYIASNIHNYQDELNQALSDIDMQICDIMHYIEIYDLDADDSIYMVDLLKECREQRRDVKDEMFRVECFQKAIGTSSNIAKAKDSIKQMNKLSARIYYPRKLQRLFENCPEKTMRHNKLLRAFECNTCMDIENGYCEKDSNGYGTEEEGVMVEHTKQKTVFDGKLNNWLQFAKQQAEFFANAEQYIYNLQADMNELDREMEQTLHEIENANYNVTQGYKVFKHLKELRNIGKEKQKELDCLYILTERFDCSAMAEAMEACVSDLESVLAEPEQDKK
ncbi:MAG: hypothetical protein HDR08_01105 [Lachnospiraceae bacterium]|nr:hypothetical protein [Lachnospiraceae bacterium]